MELDEKIGKILEEGIHQIMERPILSDCTREDLLLLQKYWEFKNQHCINRLNLIDQELQNKPE